ncbi:indolepyruvate ferredoxin oxidoreductase family protein [Octadecabacter sp. G9-8]|uniref:Indolepyruvate ferredoxin oxidoreductase family protein n=1 Tax=Octadecabacter dasysiphoniae TaxID=2909341 RepID=A0ABS9D3A3_9RHOB|nr:indolepyruvate ferredoxin oxidoreductase family protein [Octadecabacter dasysiphoniae]MCF2872793.1 indolepyruvate ferredoxin oxidoreductase family protein [Octadecabacter dasysiphoniae]
MTRHDISLSDRYDLEKDQVLLNGTQALVRLMLMQKARDRAAGLNTAGYVTGYRGSPLGAVDMQMERAAKPLAEAEVKFQPGLNEDLAATALWGTQQAELRGEGTHDGVFGLWYGKGPGVDRSGDVMRHANMAGTSPHGGVIMAMGDDHTGESSTTLHQSDWAMVDAYMPMVSPAGVQEVLDLGLYAYALSRFSGCWVGLKTMKDTIEVTSVVDGDPHRVSFVEPDFDMPDGGLNIRLIDTPVAQEARTIDHKRLAAEAFARANRIDKVVWPATGAKIGFVAAGKNWLDLVHALSLLGIDEDEAARLGISTYKVAQVWPLDVTSFNEWAQNLDLIVVVEEKRKLIEVQIKEALFDDRRGRRVYGWHKGDVTKDGRREELFPTRFALDPVLIAEKLGMVLSEEDCVSDGLRAGIAQINEVTRADNAADLVTRTPYFCSGCPHNSSTKVPEGSRAYAGIGCHYLVQWMDRDTLGSTQMGGEGANWVGEAPFSTTDHVFQNMGDGTYNHSGVQAIRFALMADTNVTYKVLYNDAVAMTGGQGNDGGLTHDQICREVLAMGVKTVHLVHDPSEGADLTRVPAAVAISTRDKLEQVQQTLHKTKGVSVLVYVQTCAAEKRRRRKRGAFADPDKRVFINTDVCEGCGDCGVQSNCVSIVPVETELGRKRAIDQSSCNKDFSCVSGFCPSFVTVQGAKLKKTAQAAIDLPEMPEPVLPTINGTHNVVITGVGGTGVVTIGAVLAMAAHVDGKAASMMEMAGLAQKGGAVHIHCRLAEKPSDISAIRVATGECDTLIGGDLVVSAGAKTLGLMAQGRTRAVVNAHEIMTGEFTRNIDFKLPSDRLSLSLSARIKDGLSMFDASQLAAVLMGDAIYSNMMVFGAAWQQGAVPVSGDAIRRAIELNGTAVARNLQAFEYGRWAVLHPDEADKILSPNVQPKPKSTDERIAFRAQHLTRYQNADYAKRYTDFVAMFDGDVRAGVAQGYHKLLSYKDEYEVARLLIDTRKQAEATFDGDLQLTHHLAPPLLSRVGPDGRPQKIAMPRVAARLFPLLAGLKRLRGTRWDVFANTEERRMERALIAEYERDMKEVRRLVRPDTLDAAVALARLPLDIRGFGPVKIENAARAAKRREELLAVLRQPQGQVAAQ